MFKNHVWKESLVALTLILGLSTVAQAIVTMDETTLNGNYKVFFQEVSIESTNDQIVSGIIDFSFAGNGNCTWSVVEDFYTVDLANPTSVTPVNGSDSGICTYTVSSTGLVDVVFDGNPEDTETWQLSTDGNYLLGGGAEIDTLGFYDNFQDIGIKLGTGLAASSLNGVYRMRAVDFEFYHEGSWLSDEVWTDKFGLQFNGSGGCSLLNYSGNSYSKGFDNTSPVEVWPDTMPNSACTYTVGPTGNVVINLLGEIIDNFWVSADTDLIVRGGGLIDETATDTVYSAKQMFGVKKNTSANNASLNGTFYFNTQEAGFTQFTDSQQQSGFSQDHYYADMVFTFDGAGNCTGSFVDALFSTTFFAPFATFTEGGFSRDMGTCTYSVTADGVVTITFPDDAYEVKLSADGELIQFAEEFYDEEVVDGTTRSTYGVAHGLAIKVLGYELEFSSSAEADFNADGSSDVLFQNNNDGRLLLWGMTNHDNATIKMATSLANTWDVVGKGDFNNDGTADVLYRKTTGEVAIAEFTDLNRSALKFPGGIRTVWDVKAVGDFDGDGSDDILFQRDTDGVTTIWEIENSTRQRISYPGALASFWRIAGVGDFNNDGTDDILCQHKTDGRLLVWEMNNLTRATVKFATSLASAWSVVGVGDFNEDGTDDVLYRKSTGETAIAAFNNLNRSSLTFPGGIGTPWSVKAVGDFDGDGTDDVLFRRGSDGVTIVWGIVGLDRSSVHWPGALGLQWVTQ